MWLNTTPDKQDSTRLEQFIKNGTPYRLPKMGCAYLFEYLLQSGACLHSGTGLIPITWQELQSYQEQQGIELSPFEIDVIRAASNAYVHQSQLSTEPNCPPPDRVVQHEPKELAKHIKNILR